jgi:formylglycine-generating enzyme required for sulfatase activity
MGRLEVLKVVGANLVERPGVRDRFLREVQSAAKLHHTNIVGAYSALRLGEGLVLAMEYVEGLDLQKMVKTKGPLPVAHACYFIHQAALGLQHAHERGMVHRDIKPANLILAPEGKKAVVKVLDFGLAKVSSEGQTDSGLTREGQMLGTPDYIAPEQIRNAQSADIRADIYSLGCTFYYLLSGGPPFRGEHLWDVYQAHFSMDAGPLNLVRPEVPVELAALVAKMMAKDPGRRFQTPGEVARALAPFFKPAATRPTVSTAEISHVNRPVAPTQVSGAGPATRRPTPEAAAPIPARGDASKPGAQGVAWESLIELQATEESIAPAKLKPAPKPKPIPKPAAAEARMRRPPWRSWPLLACAAVSVFLTLGVIIYVATNNGRIKIVIEDRNAVVQVDGATARIESLGEPITLRAGEHALKIKWGDGEFETRTFVVKRGENEALRVEYEPKTEPKTATKAPELPKPADQAKPSVAAHDGFVQAFNGKNLDGWFVDSGPRDSWRVDEEGNLVVTGPGDWKKSGFLLSNREYADFVLRFDFLPSWPTNSGVAIRALRGELFEGVPHHPQLELLDADKQAIKNGSFIWSRSLDVRKILSPNTPVEMNPTGSWNKIEVEVHNELLRFVVNDREVIRSDLSKLAEIAGAHPGLKRRSGRIGFQSNTGTARFRNIEIKELGGTAVPSGSNGTAVGRPGAGTAATTALSQQSIKNSIGMTLKLIPAGEFFMGPSDGDKDSRAPERLQHKVRISKPFYLGVCEVTQAQYEAVMGNNPSTFSANGSGKDLVAGHSTDRHPVENVTWLEATRFCNKLSEKERKKPFYEIDGKEIRVPDWNGPGYRLPTEAEWEYACRANASTPMRFSFGNDAAELGDYAWFKRNSDSRTHPTGLKKPNGFGLYDMHGNVWEWCWDWQAAGYDNQPPADDPTGPAGGSNRIFRGGSWYGPPRDCRSAFGEALAPGWRWGNLGFRLAMGQSGR